MAYEGETRRPCTNCGGIGCAVCRGSGRMRGRGSTVSVRIDGSLLGSPPPPRPYRLPDQVCKDCFFSDFPRELANTYCYDAEWVILGFDDMTGTKNPDSEPYYINRDGKYVKDMAPATPPRFFWARGMWGIQIRLYKDANA